MNKRTESKKERFPVSIPEIAEKEKVKRLLGRREPDRFTMGVRVREGKQRAKRATSSIRWYRVKRGRRGYPTEGMKHRWRKRTTVMKILGSRVMEEGKGKRK